MRSAATGAEVVATIFHRLCGLAFSSQPLQHFAVRGAGLLQLLGIRPLTNRGSAIKIGGLLLGPFQPGLKVAHGVLHAVQHALHRLDDLSRCAARIGHGELALIDCGVAIHQRHVKLVSVGRDMPLDHHVEAGDAAGALLVLVGDGVHHRLTDRPLDLGAPAHGVVANAPDDRVNVAAQLRERIGHGRARRVALAVDSHVQRRGLLDHLPLVVLHLDSAVVVLPQIRLSLAPVGVVLAVDVGLEVGQPRVSLFAVCGHLVARSTRGINLPG